MKANRSHAGPLNLESNHLVSFGLVAVIVCSVGYPSAALSSSGDEWAKLADLMKRAESQCVAAYRKENPAAKEVKHVQPSQYSASFILVTLEEALTVEGRKDRKQSSCMVGRRAGKAELAGPLP